MRISRIEVISKVISVTVYQGRAMITRRAELSLEAGNQVLVFKGLPAGIDRDSIQVKGTGEAVLGDCGLETEFFTENVDAKKQSLLERQRKIEDDISEVHLKISACEKEKQLIEKIINSVTTPAGQTFGHDADGENTPKEVNVSGMLDAAAWEGMLNFYHDKNAALDESKLAAERCVRELELELEKLQSELDLLGYGSDRALNNLTVGLNKEKPGELIIELSYMVSGPSWRPVYSIRASHESGNLNLEYDAQVQQGTGEDWVDVELKLSTARVNVSGTLPVLDSWRLHSYRPVPSTRMAKKRSRSGEDGLYGEMAKEADDEYPAAEMSALPDEFTVPQAEIDTAGASVVFVAAGGGSINGDNSDTRVGLMRRELKADFHYASVPKLSEFAYLTADVKNTTEFPFLPGKANVFFDGSFVSSTELPLIMPDQNLEISLGVDEGVNIEYRYLKRFKKNEGLMNKRVGEQFEYQIRVSNNRLKEIEIKIYDHFPISEEKEILIKRIAPVIKENQQEISIDDEAKIQWQLKLDPGEKRELPYSFLVEYPAGSGPVNL